MTGPIQLQRMLLHGAEMKRWDRIRWVREFSSAKVADGQDVGGMAAKFARSARVKSEEYQQRYRSKCQQIFDRQVPHCLGLSMCALSQTGASLQSRGHPRLVRPRR